MVSDPLTESAQGSGKLCLRHGTHKPVCTRQNGEEQFGVSAVQSSMGCGHRFSMCICSAVDCIKLLLIVLVSINLLRSCLLHVRRERNDGT